MNKNIAIASAISAGIVYVSIIAGFVGASYAKALPQNQPTPSIAPSAIPNSQKLNLPLLVKTGEVFFKNNSYQTLSQMQVKGVNQGTNVTFNVQSKTLVQSPRSFRSEIAFTQEGKPAKQSAIVVSDGKNVYIYRPDLRQYAVSSYQEFNKSDDTFLIGLSSSFFLEFANDIGKMINSGAFSTEGVIEELGTAANQVIKGETRTIEGKELYVYSYNDTKQGYTISAFVNPQVANLEQMQIVGKNSGFDISIIEKIQQRTEVKMPAPQAFKFAPPKDALRVKTLSISPF